MTQIIRVLRKAASAAMSALPGLIRDAAGLSGVGLVSYGAWLAYPPSGFIVAGLLLLLGVLLNVRAEGAAERLAYERAERERNR